MDWRLATRYALIGAAIIAGVLLAVFVFTAVWARLGLGAAVLLLVVAFFLLRRWDDRQAARDRERFARGR